MSATAWKRLVQAAGPLVRSRLFQFAVLGGALFAIAPRPSSPLDIEIKSERLAALRAFEASRGASARMPAPRAEDVDQREIEDEILYREGVRLGLDKNDGIVRQRVVQRVLFLAEEVAGASRPPTDDELRAFFESNRERWALPEQVRFAQVYRHDREVLAAWAAGPQAGDPPLGEPAPVPAQMEGDRSRIDDKLGAGFFEALTAAPAQGGAWVGPIRSAFGWHLVRVLERRSGRPAQLDEVRGAVVEAYSLFRRQEATAAFLENAFARYRVTIDGEPLRRFKPSRRMAYRSVPSGED